jgi:hypothetical protein
MPFFVPRDEKDRPEPREQRNPDPVEIQSDEDEA